jgi:hypothetical protein
VIRKYPVSACGLCTSRPDRDPLQRQPPFTKSAVYTPGFRGELRRLFRPPLAVGAPPEVQALAYERDIRRARSAHDVSVS